MRVEYDSVGGDGWEREAEKQRVFLVFSTKAYAMGVNIVVYALTH